MSQTETTPATEPAIPPDPIVHKSYAVPIWIASAAVVLATALTIADEGWFRRPYKGVQGKYRETYSAYLEKVQVKRQAFFDDVLKQVDDYKAIAKQAEEAQAASRDEAAQLQAALDSATSRGRRMTEAVKESKSEIAALGYLAESKAHAAGKHEVEHAEEAKPLLDEIERIRRRDITFTWTESTAVEGHATPSKPDKTETGKVGALLEEALAIEVKKAELQKSIAKATAAGAAAEKKRKEWLDTNRSNLSYVMQNCDDATKRAIAAAGIAKYLDEQAVVLAPDTLASMREAVQTIPSGISTLLPGDSGIRQIHIKDAARPGQVPGAEFQGVLSLNVQASTEAGLRAALGPLVSDANAPDHEQRRQARAGIIESAPPFLDSLIASFATDDFLGFAAVDALGRIATPASRGLLRDLYRLDKETRGSGVVLALARIAHPDEAAFFETVLGDATVDGLSRQYAALGLGRIGGDRVVKQLARALTVASADARPWIATALGNTRSREAVPVLIGMWGDAPSQDFVCGALRTLTHQHWCEGTANPPAQKQAEWTRRWKDTGAKAPIFGPDDCPTDLVFGTTLDPRSRQPRPLP